MKKFLFTLLTLFMASSAFAEGGNYFYMDNFTVVKTKLGTVTVKADVKGHFDNYVSAWQLDLGYVGENGEVVMNELPEGITKVTSAAGDDMKNLPYIGEDGEEAEYSPNIKKGMNGTRLIVAADEGNYSPDGELYGCVKWAPGDYDKMMVLTFTCSKDFTGAKLILKTLPSCGADTRPEISENLAPTVLTTSPECIVDVKYIAPEPVFTWNETTYTMDAAVPEGYNAEDYEIVMYANGVQVEFPYTVEQTTDEQTIVFTAYTKHAADETYDSNDATYGKTTTQTVTVPAKQQKEDCESPSVMGATGENGTYYIQITPDPATDGALQYTVDVDPVSTETIDGIVYLYYNRGAEDVTVHVEAWTNEGTEYNASEKEIKDIVVPKLPQVATPVVTFTGGNGTIYVSATCATEGATVVLYDPEGNAVDMPAEVNYDIYEGYDATWTATATAPNMLPSATGENHIVIAADQKATVDSPSIMGYNDEDGVHFNIVITPDPATDGELKYTVDPAPGTKAETLVYTRGNADYTVHVEAWTEEGATCLASDKEIKDVVVPALGKTAKPSVTYSYENGELTVWAYGSDEDAVYTLYCDGVEYTGEMPITYDIYEGYNHTWTATAQAPNKQVSDMSDDCVIEIAAQPKVYTTPDPVIGDPVVNDENVTVPVTGEGHIVVTVTMGTETLTFEGDNSVNVVIPRGTEDDFAIINAVATAPLPAGYDEVMPGRATSDLIDIPKKEEQPVTEKPGVPEIKQVLGETTVTVSATAEGADEVHMYQWDPTANNGEGDFVYGEDGKPVEIENPTTYNMGDEPQTFYVMAVATNDAGDTWTTNYATVVIPANPATGVDELVNGKTVAGVRYFNMAGQEMQEANGITIVVTTYTDGTTSAVKVIK